ncbi:MAG: cytochrome c biogenesis protein CcdA [Candidatus Limnocylindria bacterium]
MELSLGLAFVAGVVSFVSPCVLALVPVYVAYLGDTAAVVETPDGRSHVVGHAALFCLAFGVVFVLAGVSVGLLGNQLFRLPGVREVAGVVVIVVGVMTTGVFGPVLARLTLTLPMRALPEGRSARSVALGAFFAVGWSPCIGPVLGAILALGASSADVAVAAALLAFYAAGLALPFLAAAVALPRITPVIALLRRRHRGVEIAAGLFIVAMGVLIYLNAFGRMAALFTLGI